MQRADYGALPRPALSRSGVVMGQVVLRGFKVIGLRDQRLTADDPKADSRLSHRLLSISVC